MRKREPNPWAPPSPCQTDQKETGPKTASEQGEWHQSQRSKTQQTQHQSKSPEEALAGVLNKCVGGTARILDNAESRRESCRDSTRSPRAITTWLARNSKDLDTASTDRSKSEQSRPVDTPGTLHKWIATSPTRRRPCNTRKQGRQGRNL